MGKETAKMYFPFDAAKRVRMLVLDVDGVLSDGRVILLNSGEEAKSFNVRDGHGIKMLQRSGIEVALLTGRKANIVNHRAKELGICHVIQGSLNKDEGMARLCEQVKVSRDCCAYMGDDVVDLPAMQGCALSAAPADAHIGVRHRVTWVSSTAGGHGAVRELAEGLILAQGNWKKIITARYGLTAIESGWSINELASLLDGEK
ncbi:MAG: HAD hydrolase family protein [Mariprofundaceae bacterium]|nr:HAD hydrolase family protein [Mariprofundaceae bacterium]